MVLEQTDMSRWIYKYMFTGTWQSCAFCPRACQQYFVYNRNFNWPHACLYRVHYIIFWGRAGGDRGFWVCDIARIVMCTVLHRRTSRIVTKSLYRTAQWYRYYLKVRWQTGHSRLGGVGECRKSRCCNSLSYTMLHALPPLPPSSSREGR